jgi:hypothetical protein
VGGEDVDKSEWLQGEGGIGGRGIHL